MFTKMEHRCPQTTGQKSLAILDTRIVPLAYALIRRGFNSVGDTSDESADTLRILMARLSPSLLSRFATFVSNRGTSQLRFCWSDDYEECRSCVESIFQEFHEQFMNVSKIVVV